MQVSVPASSPTTLLSFLYEPVRETVRDERPGVGGIDEGDEDKNEGEDASEEHGCREREVVEGKQIKEGPTDRESML